MEFGPNEDQRMLADTLARYLAQRYPTLKPHGYQHVAIGFVTEHWTALAELGVIGALFAEEVGGFGGTGGDIATVFEQFGRALVVEPFLGTLMTGHILAQSGEQEGLLGEMIAGTSVVAFAHDEPHAAETAGTLATLAQPDGEGWSLTGIKSVVSGLDAADRVLVSATVPAMNGEAQSVGLFLIESGMPGQHIRVYPLIDGGAAGELALAGASATLVTRDAASLLEAALCAGIVALCWEAVGIMDMLKAATIDYLRTRKQFGVPIGKFQALQHRLAGLALEIEQARSAAINAASALDRPPSEREFAASAAKHTIGRVGSLVAEEAIQMHGGIGMTWELPLSHYAKRLIMIDHQLGDEDHHLARYTSLAFAS